MRRHMRRRMRRTRKRLVEKSRPHLNLPPHDRSPPTFLPPQPLPELISHLRAHWPFDQLVPEEAEGETVCLIAPSSAPSGMGLILRKRGARSNVLKHAVLPSDVRREWVDVRDDFPAEIEDSEVLEGGGEQDEFGLITKRSSIFTTSKLENPVLAYLHLDIARGYYFEAPNSPYYNPTEAFTLSVLVRPLRSPIRDHQSVLTSRRAHPVGGYMLYITPPPCTWQVWTGDGRGWKVVAGPAVEFGKWVHLCASFSGNREGNMTFYVDGKLVAQSAIGCHPNNDNCIRVGAGSTEGEPRYLFHGDLADVRIWDTDITATQVAELHSWDPIDAELRLGVSWKDSDAIDFLRTNVVPYVSDCLLSVKTSAVSSAREFHLFRSLLASSDVVNVADRTKGVVEVEVQVEIGNVELSVSEEDLLGFLFGKRDFLKDLVKGNMDVLVDIYVILKALGLRELMWYVCVQLEKNKDLGISLLDAFSLLRKLYDLYEDEGEKRGEGSLLNQFNCALTSAAFRRCQVFRDDLESSQRESRLEQRQWLEQKNLLSAFDDMEQFARESQYQNHSEIRVDVPEEVEEAGRRRIGPREPSKYFFDEFRKASRRIPSNVTVCPMGREIPVDEDEDKEEEEGEGEGEGGEGGEGELVPLLHEGVGAHLEVLMTGDPAIHLMLRFPGRERSLLEEKRIIPFEDLSKSAIEILVEFACTQEIREMDVELEDLLILLRHAEMYQNSKLGRKILRTLSQQNTSSGRFHDQLLGLGDLFRELQSASMILKSWAKQGHYSVAVLQEFLSRERNKSEVELLRKENGVLREEVGTLRRDLDLVIQRLAVVESKLE